MELELLLESKNSEFDAATVKLGSTVQRLCFARDAASLMSNQAQSEGATFCEIAAAHVAAEAAWEAAETNVQLLTASDLAVPSEGWQ